jgi:hypothetical protein
VVRAQARASSSRRASSRRARRAPRVRSLFFVLASLLGGVRSLSFFCSGRRRGDAAATEGGAAWCAAARGPRGASRRSPAAAPSRARSSRIIS